MARRSLTRMLVLGPLALAFACSSDPAAKPPTPNGTADAGATNDLPETCDGVIDALKEFTSAHTACDDANPCQNTSDLNHSALCSTSFSPGADAESLQKLKEHFANLGCSDNTFCPGGGPFTPSCNHGTCGFTDAGEACYECPTEVAPVCTVGGTNSRNACTAVECDNDTVKHEGYCETGPSCAATGGTCQILKQEEGAWFCPEGQRFDPGNARNDCASGHFDNTCCRPDWSFPCTYLGAFSSTLSLDPFTCAEATYPVCLFGASMESCSTTGKIELSMGAAGFERLDDQTTITVETGARLTVKGHAADGRTFECSGVATTDFMGNGAPWACKACLGDACSTCTINQTAGCQLL